MSDDGRLAVAASDLPAPPDHPDFPASRESSVKIFAPIFRRDRTPGEEGVAIREKALGVSTRRRSRQSSIWRPATNWWGTKPGTSPSTNGPRLRGENGIGPYRKMTQPDCKLARCRTPFSKTVATDPSGLVRSPTDNSEARGSKKQRPATRLEASVLLVPMLRVGMASPAAPRPSVVVVSSRRRASKTAFPRGAWERGDSDIPSLVAGH